MASERAAFVIDRHWGPREVCVLSATRASTIGGRDADVDLGAREVIATVNPNGWRLEYRGTTQSLHHGQRLRLEQINVQFLVSDDLTRALDDQRYLDTIIDPATNMFTRRFANTHAGRIRTPAAFLMLDLDHLKRLNDTYGFTVGDRMLQLAAARIQSHVHWPDVAIRFGGEEFLVILPDTARDQALDRAEAIRREMELPFEVDGEHPILTISIGLAMLADGFAATLQRANECLDLAKSQGRNRVVTM